MAMASSISKSPPRVHLPQNTFSPCSSPVILSFSSYKTTSLGHSRLCALKTGSDGGKVRGQDAYGSDFLRKPMVAPAGDKSGKDLDGISDDDGVERRYNNKRRDEEERVDWEDQILEDTVPLVGFVRMILHSGKYESGDRLSPEHEQTIIDRLLRYHPECEKKIGCGIDYITIGYHPDFEGSRCFFIVRKNGELVDFSYWKCIKSLIRKNYPQHADTFILRHFRRRRQ